jgi:hypothetical protein
MKELEINNWDTDSCAKEEPNMEKECWPEGELEPVHDPIVELEGLYKLIKTGGFLYLDLPNIGSFGHHVWSQSWMGIDVPRHLNLPSRSILCDTLQRIGFKNIKFYSRPGIWKSFSVKSARLNIGRRFDDSSCDESLTFPKTRDYTIEALEFLTITCIKPENA